MTSLELAVSDDTIWSITLESSILILEASFTPIYNVYSKGITYDDPTQCDQIGRFLSTWATFGS